MLKVRVPQNYSETVWKWTENGLIIIANKKENENNIKAEGITLINEGPHRNFNGDYSSKKTKQTRKAILCRQGR